MNRMRRKRHKETQVWHDPHLTNAGKRQQTGQGSAQATSSESEEDADTRKRRGRRRLPESKREGVRIVERPEGTIDPREAECERLLSRLLTVEGRPAITSAAQAYLDAGFQLPPNQLVWLQLLEHRDERTVGQALEQLTEILFDEVPARRAVLDSRLRRIEELADDATLRERAGDLRRLLAGRGSEPSE